MRNLQAKLIKLPQFKLRVIRPKKGKGSYKRKGRIKRPFLLASVLTYTVCRIALDKYFIKLILVFMVPQFFMR